MNIRKRTWTWNGKEHSAWQLDWREGGVRRQKQFRTRQEAEFYRDKLITDRQRIAYGPLADPGTTFEAFLAIYTEKKTFRTETYRERVWWALQALRSFNDYKLSDITPSVIDSYQRTRLEKDKVSPSTVRQELATLSDVFRLAVRLRYVYENPVSKIERPSLPVKQDDPADFMPFEDFEKLLKKAGQDGPLYEFAVATGLRESELVALEWPDLKDGFVIVRMGKGRKQRIVPLIPQAAKVLEKVPRRLKEPRIFWWVRSRYDVYRRFRRRLKWAEMEGRYTFHALRHTYASYAAMSGMDLKVIAKNLGHSHTTVTRRYAHLAPAYQREESEKLAAFWRRRGGTKVTRMQQESHKTAKK